MFIDRNIGVYDPSVLAPTYSNHPKWALPSALAGLTAVFGMGTGVPPPPGAPGLKDRYVGISCPLIVTRKQ